MSTLTLTPKLQITQPAITQAARTSISGAFHNKLVKWIEKNTTSTIGRRLMRCGGIVLLALSIFAPSFALGLLTSILKWNSFRIPIFSACLFFLLNAKRFVLFIRRRNISRASGNQHTFHGLSVGDLAAFLIQTSSWKREQAISTFALSQGRYTAIAEALKKHGILVHGENNAHVLRPISQPQLVEQLRALAGGKVPPLVFDPEREIWVERTGTFARWTLDQDFKRRKLDDETKRAERRLQRAKSAFRQIAALSA